MIQSQCVCSSVLAIKALLAAKADTDVRSTYDGATALHYAVQCDYPEVIRLLLRAGARRDIQDGGGHTADATARYLGRAPISTDKPVSCTRTKVSGVLAPALPGPDQVNRGILCCFNA